jgi:hypothetical protein
MGKERFFSVEWKGDEKMSEQSSSNVLIRSWAKELAKKAKE